MGDFWLNEGFTTYIENRIQEAVYGRDQALMEQVLARRELDHELATFDKRDQILHIDLKGRDPDDGTTQVPYIKGALLLRQMEEVFGRAIFDGFLKRYFDKFAFQSITTATMLDYLQQNLFAEYPPQGAKIPIHQWVYEPGVPLSAPTAESTVFEEISENALAWADGKMALSKLRLNTGAPSSGSNFSRRFLPRSVKEKMASLTAPFISPGPGTMRFWPSG